MAASVKKFRSSFKLQNKISWYPGHMRFSFIKMQAKMRSVDCIVEVHDSRIPFTGRNPKFVQSLIGSKPHILVLNKRDLINCSSYEDIKVKCSAEECHNVLFTNCLNQKCEELKSSYKMMVIGVPNVGKSSIINALRNINLGKGKAVSVGALPGITKSVQNEIKISTDPSLFLIDTPGILPPSITDIECGMKLALCACIKDDIIGIQTIADFLLYWMNRTQNHCYVKHFNLNEPVDDILPVLVKIAVENNLIKKVRNIVTNSFEEIPNIESAAQLMVGLFRKGKFGDLDLDKNYLSDSLNS